MISMQPGRRTEMKVNNLESSGISKFFASLKDRGTELPCPQSAGPLLYLKCWGSDYPYLQGAGQEKRWLPAPMDSAPRRLAPLKEGH
jgi:hypothetical protein